MCGLDQGSLSNMYHYRAFGRIVASELELPEFEPVDAHLVDRLGTDVHITRASLPAVPLADRNAGLFRVRGREVDFEIPKIVRVRVARPDCIEVDLLDLDREREARLFVTGSAFGAWAMRNGRLPFHCGVVTKGGFGFALTGPKGAGKSTLTTALVQRGLGLMSDDVVLLDAVEGSSDGEGRCVTVTPSFARIKLWQDSAEQLDIDTSKLSRLARGEEKYHVPFPQDRVAETAQLAGVFALTFNDACEQPECRKLKIPEALAELRSSIYRPDLVPALNLEEKAFALVSAILTSVPVYEFVRPRDLSRLSETADALAAQIDALTTGAIRPAYR